MWGTWCFHLLLLYCTLLTHLCRALNFKASLLLGAIEPLLTNTIHPLRIKISAAINPKEFEEL